MSSSEQQIKDAVELLRKEGYIVWQPDFAKTRQQCFYCGQWQSVEVMKPMDLSGLTELVCAVCYNKMIAREDTLRVEMERSAYESGKHPGEGSAFSRPEEGGDNSGEE
jgi:hypothetical protein